MKTIKLKTFYQNPDNPQKYGDDDIAALVESIRKEPRTLGAAKIAFCTDYTATNGASYAGRRVVIAGNKRLQALQQIAREGGLRDPGDASAWLVSPQGDAPAAWFFDLTPLGPDARRHWLIESNIGRGEWDAEKLLAQFTRDELVDHFDDLDELLGETDAGDDGAVDDENTEGDDDPDADNPEYQDFVDKFKPKKTTDDCYTPPTIYAAVAKWVADRYNVNAADFARPFYPGGDFERFSYAPGAIVVDNPPFSILSKIIDFYIKKNIRFFLFAPAVSCFNCLRRPSVSCVAAHSAIVYENGAIVPTAFITNMGEDIIVETAPDLNAAIKVESEKIRREKTKQLRKLAYPYAVATAARLGWLSVHGEKIAIKRSDAVVISRLDAMDKDDGIYGSGLLLSERAAAERAAAERAAAERAAALTFELSPRELEIQKTLGAANAPR